MLNVWLLEEKKHFLTPSTTTYVQYGENLLKWTGRSRCGKRPTLRPI